jgi:hypothetical protein
LRILRNKELQQLFNKTKGYFIMKIYKLFLISTFLILPNLAYADCNDSFSVTDNSITINWDYNNCKNIKNSGDVAKICWHKQGTIGLVCNSGNFTSSSKTGSMNIVGLSAGTTYRVKTQYKRAYWDEVTERYIATNSSTTSSSGAPTPYINVSGAQGNCRTITWGGVGPKFSTDTRELIIQRRISKFGIFTNQPSTDVSTISPSSTGDYIFQKCGFQPSYAYRVSIGNKPLGATLSTEITPVKLFW